MPEGCSRRILSIQTSISLSSNLYPSPNHTDLWTSRWLTQIMKVMLSSCPLLLFKVYLSRGLERLCEDLHCASQYNLWYRNRIACRCRTTKSLFTTNTWAHQAKSQTRTSGDGRRGEKYLAQCSYSRRSGILYPSRQSSNTNRPA